MIPEHEANQVLRLFLGQSFPSLRSSPAESDASVSDKKVQAYEKVYNIGNRWICADCILEAIAKPSRPLRRFRHPLIPRVSEGEPQEPDIPSSSIFHKIDKVVLMRGTRSEESIENAISHLRYYLKTRYGQESGVCTSCAPVFGENEDTQLYRIGDEELCIDCILDRIDSLDRQLYPS